MSIAFHSHITYENRSKNERATQNNKETCNQIFQRLEEPLHSFYKTFTFLHSSLIFWLSFTCSTAIESYRHVDNA